MPLRRPSRKSLSRQVLENMESLIREGEWPLGSKIPSEGELTKLFEVSHNTVREAVQGLIHAGLLAARPGDGTYVIAGDRLDAALDDRLHADDMDLARILEARLAIEQAIVALAAQSCTETDLKAMEKALERCRRRTAPGIEADMAFHACIADSTRNPILSQIYRVLTGHLSQHLSQALEERQYDPSALALHDELLAALRRRDSAAARDIVEKIVAFDTESLRR